VGTQPSECRGTLLERSPPSILSIFDGISWSSCAAILATYSVSSSTAFMPFIFGHLGYAVAPALLGLYFLVCGYLQQKMCEIALGVPSVRTMPDLAGAVVGRFGRNAYQFLQVLNQQLFIPCAILFSVDALKKVVGPSSGLKRDLPGVLSCNVVWLLLIVGIALLGANAMRRFGHAGWICKLTCILNIVQILFIGLRVVLNPSDRTGDAEALPPWPLNDEPYRADPHGVATNRANWVEVFQAISLFCYCYVPCFIATEAMQELNDKQEVKKALLSSTIVMYFIYALVGLVPSIYWGWNRTENVLFELQSDFFGRAANLTLFIASGTDFLITSVSLNQRVQEVVDPGFDLADWSAKAVMKWFLYTLPSFSVGFLMLCFIPDLATLACLMTAFVVPFSQIIGPALLALLASRRQMIPALLLWEKAVVFVGLAVGVVMLIIGMSATAVSVWDVFSKMDVSGSFFCDAVAA
jgi:hypothetical protein